MDDRKYVNYIENRPSGYILRFQSAIDDMMFFIVARISMILSFI